MTALPLADFTDAEKAALERMEAAEPAKESLRERVAAALWESLPVSGHDRRPWPLLTMADAALDVLRGPSTCTTCGEAQAAVERVTALADELLRPVDYEVTHYRDGLRDAARQVRAALDAR